MSNNKKIVAGVNTDLLMKGALLLGSAGIALLLSSDSDKKSKKKKKGFISKTAGINNTVNSLCRAFYVYDIKKNGERDGFPVKMETADIIEI
ncbi:MAG: hypothetical protein E7509_04255 [Ruminococcus sp.]|nr:hypothetical protein [Ruminococcus sp.]